MFNCVVKSDTASGIQSSLETLVSVEVILSTDTMVQLL